MSLARKVLLVAALCVLAFAAWLWWNRPRRADMAAYVPGDSLVYAEIDSLPQALNAVVTTDAWHALAPSLGLKADFANVGWLSRVIAWTGVGPAESVVLARAQLAVTVLGFERVESGEEAATIRPRVALVAETHTGHARARAVAEKLVGDFARRAYESPRIERDEGDNAVLITWVSPENERRRIVAAVEESLVVVGNDRGAVDACLAVRRGERPALSSDPLLAEMRRRMDVPGGFAFGYASTGGSAKLLELAALAYLGRSVTDPRAQSVVAGLLPQLAGKALGAAGWGARHAGGTIEDRYFLALQNGAGGRLGQALVAAGEESGGAFEFLPPEIYQISRYAYRDPEAAWRGLNAALSSQLDALSAPFIGRFLEAALEPYGVEDPRAFLSAAGPEFVTARLDDEGRSTVLIAGVRDRAALQAAVRRRLGAGASTIGVGDESMTVSAEEERGAASFAGDYLLLGAADDVRRCLEARAAGRSLASTEGYKGAPRNLFDAAPAARTLTDERAAALSFVAYFAKKEDAQNAEAAAEVFRRKLPHRAYAVAESRFVEEGYERRTRSSFGLVGTLVTQLAPPKRD